MSTMNKADLCDTPLGKIVSKRPGWSRVFERHQLDYCCQGAKTLAEACREAQLDPEQIVDELLAENQTTDDTDWSLCRLGELIDHIVSTHHQYVVQELPRIEMLLDKVIRAHGEKYPELFQIKNIYQAMSEELKRHMFKEEQILFPAIQQLEAGTENQFAFGSLSNPIEVMEHEHDSAGEAMASIRKLTGDFSPPSGTCPTHRALFQALESFEFDLHHHVHKENFILFPRAQRLEEEFNHG